MSRPLTILHIDDDPDARLLLRELLLAEGPSDDRQDIRWLEASSVEEAVARYRDLQPDSILLDHLLGRESGVELVPGIQRVWKCPVWLLTGFSLEALRGRPKQYGAAGVIPKDELLNQGSQLRAFLLRTCTSSAESPKK